MEEADGRFEESVEVMTKAFTSRRRFSHHGKFWQFDDIVVEPPPSQKPHPPLWVAAGSEPSIRRAARRGFNLILDQYASPQQLGERIAIYRSELKAQGKGFVPTQVAVARQCYVAKDKAEAEAALKRAAEYTRRTVDVSRLPSGAAGSHVLSYANTPGATEANALYDTPEQICAQLEAHREAGVEYILLTMHGGTEQLRRFARDIMPLFTKPRTPQSAEASDASAPV
jgi:alkanesulfonate monooxygenase SsuD/methylene tetrahydromethanopterin reductase-like flavin-dependent oxidoreductase (luciferase family)